MQRKTLKRQLKEASKYKIQQHDINHHPLHSEDGVKLFQRVRELSLELTS